MPRPLNLLYNYYTRTRPDPAVPALTCGPDPDRPYSDHRDDDLTVIVNGYARPDYLPLVWEAVQYQTRRPRETWIIQNHPGIKAPVPTWFFDQLRIGGFTDTRLIVSDLNFGCWFRFLVAALHCRTRFVAIYDDDTVSGYAALDTILGELERQPGVYVGRGITYERRDDGPKFWKHRVEGWSAATPQTCRVDFGGHLWVMETRWLRDLLTLLPPRLFQSRTPGREIGEDMFVSFVAQRRGLPTYAAAHPPAAGAQWTSVDAWQMGTHPNAVSNSPALDDGQGWLDYFVDQGWQLLEYAPRP